MVNKQFSSVNCCGKLFWFFGHQIAHFVSKIKGRVLMQYYNHSVVIEPINPPIWYHYLQVRVIGIVTTVRFGQFAIRRWWIAGRPSLNVRYWWSSKDFQFFLFTEIVELPKAFSRPRTQRHVTVGAFVGGIHAPTLPSFHVIVSTHHANFTGPGLSGHMSATMVIDHRQGR